MNSHSVSDRRWWLHLRRHLLKRAFRILGGFTLFFLLTVPAIPSRPPYPLTILLPVRIVLVCGFITWAGAFLSCVYAFFISSERPSFIASWTFFLLFGVELFAVAVAVRFL